MKQHPRRFEQVRLRVAPEGKSVNTDDTFGAFSGLPHPPPPPLQRGVDGATQPASSFSSHHGDGSDGGLSGGVSGEVSNGALTAVVDLANHVVSTSILFVLLQSS